MVTMKMFFKKYFRDKRWSFLTTRAFKVCFIIFGLSIIVGASLVKKFGSAEDSQAVEVDWRLLGKLDYISGKVNSELDSLDGRSVKIPGFMVPLEDNTRNVTDFLLVPSPQACIHVPPPPPNQMVFVKMQGQGAEPAFGPIWVYGTLHLKSKKHMYGESSFSLSGIKIQPYR